MPREGQSTSEFSSNPEILGDFSLNPNTLENANDETTRNNYYQEAVASVGIRDQHFNNLLNAFYEDYKERSTDKREMKKWFFWIVSGALIVLLLSLVILPIALAITGNLTSATFIISMVASLASIISAVLTLPQVIAEYLFDPKEDEKILELIRNMQEYNIKGHERLEHHNNSNS